MGLSSFNRNREELAFPGLDVEGFSNAGKDVEAENEISKAIEAIKDIESKPMFLNLAEKRKKRISEVNMELEFKPETHDIDTIYNLLISARKFLGDLNLAEARKDYTHIMNIYNKLSHENKSVVYEDIADLYNERKNAEHINLR